LDEALSKKAVPFIAAQVRPIETNVVTLKANVDEQRILFGAMTLDVSNKQTQLTFEQAAIRKQIQPLFEEINSLQSSVNIAQEQANKLQDEQKLIALLNRGQLFDSDAIQQLQVLAQERMKWHDLHKLHSTMFNEVLLLT